MAPEDTTEEIHDGDSVSLATVEDADYIPLTFEESDEDSYSESDNDAAEEHESEDGGEEHEEHEEEVPVPPPDSPS